MSQQAGQSFPLRSFKSNAATIEEANIPQSLEFTKCRAYIIYRSVTRNDFLTWFNTTVWSEGASNSTYNLPKWESRKLAPVWTNFDTIAHKVTGKCMIQCKRCEAILEHPSTKSGSSTTTLSNHVKTGRCKDMSSKTGGGAQLDLASSIRTGNVRNLHILTI